MPEQGVATEAYAIQYSEPGRASRKDLPLDAQSAMCLIRSPPIRMPFQAGSAQSASTEECGFIPIPRRRCK